MLGAIGEAWTERRDEVHRSAATIVGELAKRQIGAVPGAMTEADCAAAVTRLQGEFDAAAGGFGGAPKFPPSMVLEALLRDGGEPAMTMVERTATAMARGGIYDQLAGGFARYSVDAGWVVPHFEKMLYDNALLLGVYTHWWRRTAGSAGRAGGGRDRRLAARRDAYAARARSPPAWTPTRWTRTVTCTRARTTSGPPTSSRRPSATRTATWAAEVFRVTPDGTFEGGASTLQLLADPDDPARLASVRDRLRQARAAAGPAGAGRQGGGRLERLAGRLPGLGGDGLRPAGLAGGRGRGRRGGLAAALAGRPAAPGVARRPAGERAGDR